jgi:biotin operon repressor
MCPTLRTIPDNFCPEALADSDSCGNLRPAAEAAVATAGPPGWSGADLAARLEVTERIVRRGVGRLRDLGYPVHASRGTDGGYRLGAGAAMPTLLLDGDETVAVAVGLRTAARSPVTGIEETSIRALAKLEQVTSSRLRRRVSAGRLHRAGPARLSLSFGRPGGADHVRQRLPRP